MTDRPAEPMPGAEPSDLPEGEPTAAPSPQGTEGTRTRESSGFGDAAGEIFGLALGWWRPCVVFDEPPLVA